MQSQDEAELPGRRGAGCQGNPFLRASPRHPPGRPPTPQQAVGQGVRLRHQLGLGGQETPLPPGETLGPDPVALGSPGPSLPPGQHPGFLVAGTAARSAAGEAARGSRPLLSVLRREGGVWSGEWLSLHPLPPCQHCCWAGSEPPLDEVGRGQLQAAGRVPLALSSHPGGAAEGALHPSTPPSQALVPGAGMTPPQVPLRPTAPPLSSLSIGPQPGFHFHKLPKKRKETLNKPQEQQQLRSKDERPVVWGGWEALGGMGSG